MSIFLDVTDNYTIPEQQSRKMYSIPESKIWFESTEM